MGCGSLRELQLLKKITFWGGGLRDGSGSANLFRSKTHGLDSRMRNCRQPTQKDACLQGASFRSRGLVIILGPYEVAFADSCILMKGCLDPSHRLTLAV